MTNNIILIGRLVKEIELNKDENERMYAECVLAVQRSYKNDLGMYDTDFIPIKLFGGVAENTSNYCEKGNVIAIKGRIEINNNKIELIAEKVTFLSSQRKDEE